MCSQNREEFVLVQKLVGCLLSKEIGTATNFILKEALRTLALLVLHWV
jgi:hypothetical protein